MKHSFTIGMRSDEVAGDVKRRLPVPIKGGIVIMRDDVHSKEFWDGVEKKATFQKQFKRPDCIILDSEYCSMGRMIAVKACESSGYAYYDAEKLMSLLKPEERELVAQYDKVLENTELTAEDLKKDKEFACVCQLYQQAIRQVL